jgi:hypothetical protein
MYGSFITTILAMIFRVSTALSLTAVVVGMILPVCAHAQSAVKMTPEIANLYTSVSINPPSASEMTICYGFVCRRRALLDFTDQDRKALTLIIAKGKASPAAERAAVQNAVVWFDRRVGPMIGTDKRIASADIRSGADATNFDCWDTTRNVSSMLLVMQEWGLFRYHAVGNPRYRGNFFVMQLPHNTAVITQKDNQSEWAVDLWPKKYAEIPDVMPLEKWLSEK